MAIVFLEQKQKQKYFIIILAIIIFLTGIVLWRGLHPASEKQPSPVSVSKTPTLEINFGTLKSSLLKELQLFEPIKPFEDGLGRKNPFVPAR